jgi:hypothetical protein
VDSLFPISAFSRNLKPGQTLMAPVYIKLVYKAYFGSAIFIADPELSQDTTLGQDTNYAISDYLEVIYQSHA